MRLQILVPVYNEGFEVVKPLLDSIAIQQNVDFKEVGVIICNDGGKPMQWTHNFINYYDNFYPFEIQYYDEPHRGVSGTRNACLDKATAEYVMFCDCDDMFLNACGLWILFREMAVGFDSLVSTFTEETRIPQTGEVIYINRDIDSTFVHGKVHRRQYLIDQNIRWNEKLTIHEDSYFNCLCQKLSTNVKFCPTPFYLWKWRDASVCRHDPKYILKTYNNMLDSNTALVKQFLQRDRRSDAEFFATNMIYDAYYTLNKKEWIDQENQEYRANVEKRFREYYKEFKSLFESVSEAVKAQIIMGQKNRFFQEGLLMEHITFDDWIKHIENDD